MNSDIEALDSLIDEAVNREKALAVQAEELSLQSKQFAEYLAAKKHNDEALEALWAMVKNFMVENNISEHENEFIKLKLTPSGKYKAKDINDVPDELCKITRTLDNKKVKAYAEINGELPEGIKSTGYILRKTLKEEE
jgi:hypothetical protein